MEAAGALDTTMEIPEALPSHQLALGVVLLLKMPFVVLKRSVISPGLALCSKSQRPSACTSEHW